MRAAAQLFLRKLDFATLALHTFDAFGVICVARNFSSVYCSF